MSRSAKDAVWAGALFWARFGINAMVFLVMARWISPSDIGSYGAAFALIQILQAVQASGIPEALIARDDDSLYFTGFWISLVVGLIFSIFVLAASYILFYLNPDGEVSRYLFYFSPIPLLIGLGAVSEAKIRKERRLNALTFRTTLTMTVAGCIAIALAHSGYGGLALVSFTLVNNGGSSILNLFISNWKPKLSFSKTSSSLLIKDATFIGVRNIVKSSISPSTQLIVTFVLGPAAGGFYLIALRLVNILSSLTLMPAQYVALPLFTGARSQGERGRAFLKATAIMGAITAPIYVGVASVAPILIALVTGQSSSPAATLVQGLLFHSPVLVLTNLGIPALVSVGKTKEAFSIVFIQALLNIPVSFLASLYSLAAVGWSYGLLYYVIAPYIIKHICLEFGISKTDIIRISLIPWVFSLVMGGAVVVLQYYIVYLAIGNVEVLALCAVLGATIYVILVLAFARDIIATIYKVFRGVR